MNLAAVFATMGSLVRAECTETEAARRLYAGSSPDANARHVCRLGVYASGSANARHEALSANYPRLEQAVIRDLGRATWLELVHRFYASHPAAHPRYLQMAAPLADFLAADAVMPSLPAWMRQLADFEIWRPLVRDDPRDDDPDPRASAPRLAATVEVRDYAFDFVGWLAGAPLALPAGAPPAKRVVVLFWRDREARSRRALVGRRELSVLAAVRRGHLESESSDPERRATARRLASLGVVYGDL